MKKQFFLLFIIFCFSFKGNSQVTHKNYKITRFELPTQTRTTDILQDKYGFVWIATINGLWRYDGGSFKSYVKNELDETSITDNHISCLFEDSKGDLWVGTYGGGLLKYSRECDCFERFIQDANNPKSLSFNEIKLVFETSDGYFFVGTDGGGLNLFNRETKEFTYYQHNPKDKNSLSHNNVLSLEESKKGELIIGTWRGLNKLNYKTGKITRLLSQDKSYHFIKKHNKLYLFQNGSLKELNANNHQLKKIKPTISGVKDAAIDKDFNLWLIHKDNVLITDSYSNPQKEISLEQVFKTPYYLHKIAICKETENMWLLDYRGWFFKVEKNPVIFKPFLNVGSNFKIHQTKKNYWVVKWKTVFVYDKESLKLVKKIPDFGNNLLVDYSLDTKSIWAADDNFYYNFSSEGELLLKKSRNSNGTYALKYTSNHKLWVGEILGAKMYDLTNFKETEFKSDPENKKGIGYFHRSRVILEDSNQQVWLGTNGDGLKKYLPKTHTFKHYRHKIGDVQTLSNNFINTLYEDKNQVLWIGTASGLCKLNLKNNQITQYNKGVLKDKIINIIVQDVDENLWIGTTDGLIKFNETKNEVRIINEQDGLISNHILNSGMLLSNGNIVMSTSKGAMVFNPKRVKSSSVEPLVYLSKLWVNNQLVKSNSNYIKENIETVNLLNLDYTDDKFEIEFQVIHFSNNQRCNYAYKLEGYDTDWTIVNKNSRATYTNIPSGKYTFLVKASNEDGVWNDKIKELKITVAPPFWDLLWVRVLGIILFFVLLIIVVKWFINKEKTRSKFEIEKERIRQFEEVAQMKLRFFTNVSHELRTPLTLITAPLNKFSEKGILPDNKVLQMMNRNSNRLLELINQILDFRKLENKQQLKITEVKDELLFQNIYDAYVYWAKEKHITFKKEIKKQQVSSVFFDVDVVQKITSNLISNALKYTPDYGKVIFKICYQQSNKNLEEEINLVLEVIDNGQGIEEKYQQKVFERYFQLDQDDHKIHGSGIGLSLCAELVALHGGTISLESKVNQGSHFKVEIPVGKILATASKKTEDIPLETEIDKEVVLVIEDHQDIREYLCAELETDYKVIAAKDGKEGLLKATEHIPNMIISDVMMPSVNGIQLAQQLKTNDLTSHIPILFLTAKTGMDNKLLGLSSGGHDYIEKPFNITEVLLKVKNILKARQDLIVKNPEIISKNDEVAQDHFLIKVNTLIDKNLENTDFNIDVLCGELAVSRSQLYRKIQSLTGKSIIEYINFYKLSVALELLKQGELNVKQVAFSVGFDDSRYFSRVFKNQFGNPPSFYIPKN
ncbi:signal transduction histidine kinase/DNA-binding response OmpR family regulator/ligand-binding sensor domain-containing protein [Wenyingzhuangia heitensis]|uniref:histidine kinase n=1 Tax=Wenyingzhuangia heitensis TaxID=1487859 RepID=A0ABX0U580_9FLAO|nr:two-component regulator propeller domain-containing protein [Wenyingzhuangia heitensis]NIJ43913.1 signal transduction histidine kinase/DNA-binding response OmpR family regulator/ligand-binding sensor domain-containing protein [Wenyingzhuangia heitensis]